MLKNNIIIAYRNLLKNKIFSLVNILGLALGLACTILIYLWVKDEISYDRFHENREHLYKIMVEQSPSGGKSTIWEWTPALLAPALEAEVPEVEHAIRLTSWQQELLLTTDNNSFPEKGYFADSLFFEVFTFPLLNGNATTVLDDLKSIVLSKSLADKYFGNENPVGRSMTIETGFGGTEQEVHVTGVFQNIPSHSSLQFDFIRPFQAFLTQAPWASQWGNYSFFTFVQLHSESKPQAVDEKVRNFIKDHYEHGYDTGLFLHAFDQMYLRNDFSRGRPATGRIVYVYMFSIVAIIVLLIACINFINLSTARAATRALEIGVKKISGASRFELVTQFLGESFFITFLAAGLALFIIAIGSQFFNQLIGKIITIPYSSPYFILIFLSVLLITGLAAGSYPSLFLSSLKPNWALKGTAERNGSKNRLREGLVIFQFVLSITLIINTLIIYNQINYIKDKDLGLDKEDILYFSTYQGINQHQDAFKNDLLQIAGIQSISFANHNPLTVGNSTSDPVWEGKTDMEETYFFVLQTDEDFIQTLGIKIKQGRDFVTYNPDGKKQYIINEMAAKVMSFKDPIGKSLTFWDDREGEIVGVVKNFHHQSLHVTIEPLIILLNPPNSGQAYVKVESSNIPKVLSSLDGVYKKYETDFPLEHHFLDKYNEQMYQSEFTTGKLANVFAFLAILISCLGLFGLALHTIDGRIKEIGIRKVLGATVRNLTILISSDFTKLVLIAYVIAIPIAWYLMHRWLQEFAYRIEIGWMTFIVAGVLAIFIAWLTVSYQTIKAALANPVDSLRNE